MPIPQFVPGEVLSAMRLNQMVEVVNNLGMIIHSTGLPFQQVQLTEDTGDEKTWQWMFRHSSYNRYCRVRRLWGNRQSGSRISIGIGGTELISFAEDQAQSAADHAYVFDLFTEVTLIPGHVYTIDIDVERGGVDAYIRILWIFNTNNASYAPTLIS
jgi:hypothetical protein